MNDGTGETLGGLLAAHAPSTWTKPWRQRCRCFGARATRGASLSDLTKAMGINRPSLYAAFGDKETLFPQRHSIGTTAGRVPTCVTL